MMSRITFFFQFFCIFTVIQIMSVLVSADSIGVLKVKIQKDTSFSLRSKCDVDTLSDYIQQEVWVRAHDEIETLMGDNDQQEFDLGDMELEVDGETSPYDHLMTVYGQQESSTSIITATASGAERNFKCSMTEESESSFCQDFQAPLIISTAPGHRQGATSKRRQRGPSMMKIASTVQNTLQSQLPSWMKENSALIGTSCSNQASDFQISVEIIYYGTQSVSNSM